ncbi:MAG TPA: acyltransferase [Fibrobacteria bacterium]|nr:acyltransferase [Fibrobacteria bacterium]
MSLSTGRAEPIHILTSLRFLPAAWVVLHHYGEALGSDGPIGRVLARGATGVSLFFVLSGFILAINYPSGKLIVRSFLAARVARIYPVYLFGLVLSLPLFFHGLLYRMSFFDACRETIHQLALCLLLVQAWFPDRATLLNPASWSLSAEMFFYLAFVPALLWRPTSRLLDRTWISVPILWGLGLALTLAWVLLHPGIQPSAWLTGDLAWSAHFLSFHPLMRVPEFLLGVALGRWHLSGGRVAHPGALAAFGFMVSTGMILLGGDMWAVFLHNTLAALPYGLLILGLAQCRGKAINRLERPTLILLGESSYALYILHMPIHDWMRYASGKFGIGTSSPGWFMAYFAISVLASIAAFRWIESPSRRRIRGWIDSAKCRCSVN